MIENPYVIAFAEWFTRLVGVFGLVGAVAFISTALYVWWVSRS